MKSSVSQENFSLEKHLLQHVQSLHAYVPGTQPEGNNWIKLNTNENPYPPSPRVQEAIANECSRLSLYPNPTSRNLRSALAQYHDRNPEEVIIGNGSDDILNLLNRIFTGRDKPAAWMVPSYSLYPTLVAIRDVEMIGIPFTRDLSLPIEEIASCGANLFFLTSPNAPTGASFHVSQIEQLLHAFSGILVVDEAYIDFAEDGASTIPLLDSAPNLVVTRTFSKSWSLAGLRVGYALASPEIIGLLDRVRDSYNVDRLAQAGALAALQDRTYFEQTRSKIIQSRERFLKSLKTRSWFTYPSATNFLFTEPRDAHGNCGAGIASDLFRFLQTEKILVRYFPGNQLTESFLRITIGTDAEMDSLSKAFDAWLKTTE